MTDRAGRAPRTAALAIVVACALLFSGCTPKSDANPDRRSQIATPFSAEVAGQLDSAVDEAMKQSGSSGAIVGVWAPWAGEWVVSPGTTAPVPVGGPSADASPAPELPKDAPGPTPLPPSPLKTDMRYRIGTNTTAMTCTVLLQLVDEGRVKLGDTVSSYLNRMAGIDDITLGQLCQNTSGLADYAPQLSRQFVNNPTRIWPPLEVVSAGLASSRLAAPGGAWAQSDTGIVLLGMALQSATNQDWNSLYDQYIFGPLGMNHTSLPSPEQLGLPDPHAQGFVSPLDAEGNPECGTVREVTELSNSMGGVAGGVVSTVEDMRIWALALADGSLLSKKARTAQWATVPQGENSPLWQGYGLGARQLGPMRGRDGAIPGFISATLADPETGLTVSVMLNNSNAGARFAQILAQRLVSIVSKAPSVDEKPAPLLELPWSEEQLAAASAEAPCQAPAPAPAP